MADIKGTLNSDNTVQDMTQFDKLKMNPAMQNIIRMMAQTVLSQSRLPQSDVMAPIQRAKQTWDNAPEWFFEHGKGLGWGVKRPIGNGIWAEDMGMNPEGPSIGDKIRIPGR